MMIPRVSLAAAGLVLLGCNDFNDGKTRSIIESNPVRLDAEQVTLTQQQVDCGVKADLWDSPVQTNDRSVARLTDKGRALKFYEDVAVAEPGYRQPFVQVRGDFMLGVLEILNTTDGRDKYTKLVETKVGVKIDHPCFTTPLPIMGLKKGMFSQDANPILRFRLDNSWQLDRIVH
ncbi:MAG: hypothetical protein DMG59_06740 [Acidobacteria bacterium]|nr:MAG: hypothetical protein DMG59_06740 [Acidobacteriota bacterium]